MLQNKVAIITGGSRGIGRAIADKFFANGARVMLVALHDEHLERAKKELEAAGGNAMIFGGDVADPTLAQRVVHATIATFGQVNILVNCAGIISRTPTESLPLDEWQRVIDVNLNGAFYFCQKVLPHMRAQGGGKIINITSQMARIPHPSAAPSYEVSKAGLAALTRHLAFHYAKHKVNVNAIAPGSIDTDMPKSMSPEARERLRNSIPVQRLGEPSEVGDLALFLASSASDYITGQTVGINGGSLMD